MTNSTTKPLAVPLKTFKRTKILATVGPATDSYEAILTMMKAGVNGFRLNFSHGTYEEREQQIKWIRQASQEYGKPVAIVEDLQGPEIRLGNFDGIIPVQPGQELVLAYDENYQEGGPLPIQTDLSKTVQRGERLLFDDGKIRTQIVSVRNSSIHVRVENEGILTKRKSINLPDTDFRGEIITAKDRQDVVFGASHSDDIDYLAMSFIQTAEDVENMRKLMKNAGLNAKIIAKIETRSAIDNLEEIVKVSDGVMVARGDLAAEVSFEKVPVVQRQIIGLCLRYEKLSIVATQMLASMVDVQDPTRAEVSDVATAVIIGADCVMLSEETAAGRYPIDAVKVMKKIILYTQENTPLRAEFEPTHEPTLQEAIAASVITLADKIKADAIVAETKSGSTAVVISAFRPSIPLIVVTSLSKTAQQLALYYGMKTFVRRDSKFAATKLTDWLLETQIFHAGNVIVSVSGKYPGRIGGTDTIKVRRLE